MADFKEEIAKIEKFAKEDEQFRNEYLAAIESQDFDKIADLFAANGFEAAAEELRARAGDGPEMDEAELDAIAGGADRIEQLDRLCGNSRSFLCGLIGAVALWMPEDPYEDD